MTSSSTRRSSSTTDSSRADAIILDLLRLPPRWGTFDRDAVSWRPLPVVTELEKLLPNIFRSAGQTLERNGGIVCVFRPSSFSATRTAAVIAGVFGFARSTPVAVMLVETGEVSLPVLRRAIRRAHPGKTFLPAYAGKPNIGRPKARKRGIGIPVHRTAGAFLLDGRNRVLLISERTGRRLTIPHGHVDRDEKSLPAVRREVREEVGRVSLRLVSSLPAVRYRFREGTGTVEHAEERYVFRVRCRLPLSSPERRRMVWVSSAEAFRRVPYLNLRRQLRLIAEMFAASEFRTRRPRRSRRP